MTTTTPTSSYNWIKRIPRVMLEKDSAPLVGFPPEFPWAQFSAKLAALFEMTDLTVKSSGIPEWRTQENLLSGIGECLTALNLSIAPLSGNVCWVMAEQDLPLLMSMLLTHQSHPSESIDPDFLQGFYRFLAVETIDAFTSVEFDKTLDPHIQQNKELPNETSLCLDIEITIKEKTLWGRLLASTEFLDSWKQRYAQRARITPLAQDLEVTVHLEAGRTALMLSEWKTIAAGDFLVLDLCSLKPQGEGRIMLTVDGYPCFRGKIKDGNIKILEHPLYHEANSAMDKNLPGDEAETDHNHDFAYFEEDEEDEEEQEEEEVENAAPPPGEIHAEAAAEEGELHEEPQKPLESVADEVQQKESEPVPTPPPAAEKKPFTPEDISLNVIVEVGRLQMTVGKLMDLQPGNMLDLNVHPENGVDLVVNGKRIAKGELLLIGETLGVRVLDIG